MHSTVRAPGQFGIVKTLLKRRFDLYVEGFSPIALRPWRAVFRGKRGETVLKGRLRKYPKTITVFPTYRGAFGFGMAVSSGGCFGMAMVMVNRRFQSRPR